MLILYYTSVRKLLGMCIIQGSSLLEYQVQNYTQNVTRDRENITFFSPLSVQKDCFVLLHISRTTLLLEEDTLMQNLDIFSVLVAV